MFCKFPEFYYLCRKVEDMRLKEILKEQGISGAELARRLGVTPAYINMALQGKVNLSVKKCEEVAKALDVPTAALFEGYMGPDETLCPHCGKRIRIIKA